MRRGIAVDAAEGFVNVAGQGVGGGDDVVPGVDLDISHDLDGWDSDRLGNACRASSGRVSMIHDLWFGMSDCERDALIGNMLGRS